MTRMLAVTLILLLFAGTDTVGNSEDNGENLHTQRKCQFVEQLEDVQCFGLELIQVPCVGKIGMHSTPEDPGSLEEDPRVARVDCCRQACCDRDSCQIYMVNILRQDLSRAFGCWVGNHSEFRCQSRLDGDALHWKRCCMRMQSVTIPAPTTRIHKSKTSSPAIQQQKI